MSISQPEPLQPRWQPRPGWWAAAALYLFYAAVLLRTLGFDKVRPRLPIYVALELAYLLLFTMVLWWPPRRPLLRHLYFLLQLLLVLGLQSMRLRFDFIIVLYIPLSFQTALLLAQRARWAWVAAFLLMSCIPLVIALGLLPGLAVALLPMTVCIILPAYVTESQAIESGLAKNQALLAELQSVNRRLTEYAGQVEQLSAIQERNRLARELHDSVSQNIFGISMHTRAARILLERDADELRPQLVQLRVLTQEALEEMRGLIKHLRPQHDEPGERPTP
jgi:signal transduction histidine kinase